MTPGAVRGTSLTLAQAQELVHFCLRAPTWLPRNISFVGVIAELPPQIGNSSVIPPPTHVTLYYGTSNTSAALSQPIGFEIDETSFTLNSKYRGAIETELVLAGKRVTRVAVSNTVEYFWRHLGVSFMLHQSGGGKIPDRELEHVIASIP